MGKTTLATQMEKSLLLAFEVGYNALPGVIAQDVTSWAEMRQIFRELKKPEVKEAFNAIVVDTIDVAFDKCKKYICQKNNIEELGDLAYGKGWSQVKDEFNDIFRSLTQLGYAVFFIGHDKEAKDNDGNITNIRPALSNSAREIIAGMADVYGYAKQNGAGQNSVLVLRDKTGFIECGCRFKYIPDVIEMNYNALVNAIQTAIQEEAKEHSNAFVTTEAIKPIEVASYDFDVERNTFQELVSKIMTNNQSDAVKITSVVNKYLGKNKKVSDATPEQAELIHLINIELKEDILKI